MAWQLDFPGSDLRGEGLVLVLSSIHYPNVLELRLEHRIFLIDEKGVDRLLELIDGVPVTVVEFDLLGSVGEFFSRVAYLTNTPWLGRNWDAMSDRLSDFGEFLHINDRAVVVFRQFDHFVQVDGPSAKNLIDSCVHAITAGGTPPVVPPFFVFSVR